MRGFDDSGQPTMLLPEIAEFLGCKTPDGWVQAALADLETLHARIAGGDDRPEVLRDRDRLRALAG